MMVLLSKNVTLVEDHRPFYQGIHSPSSTSHWTCRVESCSVMNPDGLALMRADDGRHYDLGGYVQRLSLEYFLVFFPSKHAYLVRVGWGGLPLDTLICR